MISLQSISNVMATGTFSNNEQCQHYEQRAALIWLLTTGKKVSQL